MFTIHAPNNQNFLEWKTDIFSKMFTIHAPNNSNFFELTTDIFQKCSQFMLQIIQIFLS